MRNHQAHAPAGASRRPSKRVVVVAAALIALALGAWALAARRSAERNRSQATGQVAAGATAGMPGMGSEGSVTLTAGQIRTFAITFGVVEVRTLESEVRAVGSVAFDETRMSQVTPKVGGFIERLHVDFTGQLVRRGQPLLELYSPELVAAQEELLLAAQLERSLGQNAIPGFPADTTRLLVAAKRRLALRDVSGAQIDDVIRTGRVRRTLTLYAPASGTVVEKRVVAGQSVMPGEHLYTIADLSRVWVETELRDADGFSVRVGSGADIEIAGLPGRSLKGRVEYIQPTVQAEARTIRARVAVNNADGTLKPGMYATVRISTPGRTVLAVPSSAIVRTGERSIVFMDMGGGSLMTQEVSVGRVAGDFTEVLGGVEAGSRVVTSAQFLIDSESNLAEVMRSMAGMGASDMAPMEDMPMPMPAPSPRPRR